jgi:hypothetical protein
LGDKQLALIMKKGRITPNKGRLLVENVVLNSHLRGLFLDRKNPRAVRTHTEKTIKWLSPEELSAGVTGIIEAIDQNTNSNTIEAKETRIAALILLKSMVECGVQNRVKVSVYKNLLIKAFEKERDKLVSMQNDAMQDSRRAVYANISALLKAEEIINSYLPSDDRGKIITALKAIKRKIWVAMTYEERKQLAKEFQYRGCNNKESAKDLGISKDTFLWYVNMK